MFALSMTNTNKQVVHSYWTYKLNDLLTAGEDTMGQLERRFGRKDAARRILQLHAVWISHMHADHHGGLYPLLLHRQHLQQQQQQGSNLDPSANGSITPPAKPLLILGPWPLFKVLCDYSKLMRFRFVFIPNTYFYTPDPRSPPAECLELFEEVKKAAGLKVLQPYPVEHVAHSTGLQLESEDGWKVVFSGRAGCLTFIFLQWTSYLASG
eukprot:GHUV01022298.1.p1 GENE.GHUV01022298.1~~GHUV01022298.1.p1  ORF type:complete len:210 (+),score=16.87 GHUV01022298.1:128-757(+)